jgi:ACS family hexuronate transporter-like MFS transporter
VFGRNEVATANGLTGMAAWTASTMFALVVGALADTIGFSPLFAVLASSTCSVRWLSGRC